MTLHLGRRTFHVTSPLRTRAGRRLTLIAVAGAYLVALAIVACGPPPTGYPYAGRMETLPAPNPSVDAGGTSSDDDGGDDMDAGDSGIIVDDSGGGDDADSGGGPDADMDASDAGEMDSGQDAGHDAGQPHDAGHVG